jgi:hypothetical protein
MNCIALTHPLQAYTHFGDVWSTTTGKMFVSQFILPPGAKQRKPYKAALQSVTQAKGEQGRSVIALGGATRTLRLAGAQLRQPLTMRI